MAGYSAHTNGPGRIDDKEYPQTVSFMTHLGLASGSFTIGSAVSRKITKKTQQVNFKCKQAPGGTITHTRPIADVDLLGVESERRTASDAREKNDKLTVRQIASALRLILRQITPEKPCSQLQVKKTHENTVAGRGYILRASNDELMEPGEYEREVRAGLGFDRASEDELKDRHTVKINRKLLHPPRKQVEVEAEVGGFERAHETVLSERKILKIRRKTEEEEKIESAAEFCVAKVAAKEAETAEDMRAKKERRCDWAEGRARKWKSHYRNLEKDGSNGQEHPG